MTRRPQRSKTEKSSFQKLRMRDNCFQKYILGQVESRMTALIFEPDNWLAPPHLLQKSNVYMKNEYKASRMASFAAARRISSRPASPATQLRGTSG
jgi:hypothetical protein